MRGDVPAPAAAAARRPARRGAARDQISVASRARRRRRRRARPRRARQMRAAQLRSQRARRSIGATASIVAGRRRYSAANTSPRCASIHGTTSVRRRRCGRAPLRGQRVERRDADDAACSSASARPCIGAMPMRRPVNEPGPVATASRSMSLARDAGARRARARSRRAAARRACATRRPAATRSDAVVVASRRTLPPRVVVSSARIEHERLRSYTRTCLDVLDRVPTSISTSRPLPSTSDAGDAAVPRRQAAVSRRDSCSSGWATSTRCSTRTRWSPRARSS